MLSQARVTCGYCQSPLVHISPYKRRRLAAGILVYCNPGCASKLRMPSTKVDRVCRECGVSFFVRRCDVLNGIGIYCSRACQFKGQVKKQPRTCKTCGISFMVPLGEIRRGNGSYCSVPCLSTDLVRLRSGEFNPMFGKRGEDAPNWKGGITPAREKLCRTPEWRKAARVVISRDKCCRLCAKKGIINKSDRHIHHIDPFSSAYLLRCDPGNLIWLCKHCHWKLAGKERRWMRRLFRLISESQQDALIP